MASNIITSDGKDLDSRYLGIGAKAASATRADSAARADVAGSASVSPVNIGHSIRKEGRTSYLSYTMPNSGNIWFYIVALRCDDYPLDCFIGTASKGQRVDCYSKLVNPITVHKSLCFALSVS